MHNNIDINNDLIHVKVNAEMLLWNGAVSRKENTLICISFPYQIVSRLLFYLSMKEGVEVHFKPSHKLHTKLHTKLHPYCAESNILRKV